MENKIDKPFSIKYREIKQTLINSINHSGLPIDVIESIVEGILAEIKSQSEIAYINDVKAYNEALEKEEQKEEEETSE